MPRRTEDLDRVDASVSALLGDLERARTLLAGLVDVERRSAAVTACADRFRRDLAALDAPGPD